MCARYSLAAIPEQIESLFDIAPTGDLEPRYNIAPTQQVPAVVEGKAGHELRYFQWGLIPSWAKDASIGHRLINARSETAFERPAFRSAMERRRCLLPTSGFYEWREADKAQNQAAFDGMDTKPRKPKAGPKQPYRFEVDGGELFAFAGLWEVWDSPSGEPIQTCTMLTTSANHLLTMFHDRMPCILTKQDFDVFLDLSMGREELAAVLSPFPDERMRAVPVNTALNNPRNEDPDLALPVGPALTA